MRRLPIPIGLFSIALLCLGGCSDVVANAIGDDLADTDAPPMDTGEDTGTGTPPADDSETGTEPPPDSDIPCDDVNATTLVIDQVATASSEVDVCFKVAYPGYNTSAGRIQSQGVGTGTTPVAWYSTCSTEGSGSGTITEDWQEVELIPMFVELECSTFLYFGGTDFSHTFRLYAE